MRCLLTLLVISIIACIPKNVFAQTCTTISLTDTIDACPHSKVNISASISIPAGYTMLDTIWTPSSGLSDSNSLTPTAAIGTSSVLYKLHLITQSDTNLVVNGNFSAGNTGFSSSYSYSSSSVYTEGFYSVTTDPHLVHPGAPSFGDHTSGTGNMMVINGASSPVDVWCESISVTPNTYYGFSAWFANWSPADTGAGTPELQFKINGVLLGSPVYIRSLPGVWQRFYVLWYSGPSTTAGVCINDLVTAPNGNDFALDDIAFKPACNSYDSVYIKIDSISIAAGTDTTICNRTSVPLYASGATTYAWSPASGLSCSACPNPVATPINTTTYTVTGTNAIGCASSKTVTVTVNQLNGLDAGSNKNVCMDSSTTLTASGAVSYIWKPSSGLSCDTCTNPVATPSANTMYVLTGTDSNGCIGIDSVFIVVNAPSSITAIREPNAICSDHSVQLSVSGAVKYNWSPGKYLNDSTIANPTAIPQDIPITYYVMGRNEPGCISYDSVTVQPFKKAVVGFPSAFSPNGDGANDILYVRGANIATVDMSVYNRWGQKVFETKDMNTGWDGTFNGSPQPIDAYSCILKVTTLDGCIITKQGSVTLLK